MSEVGVEGVEEAVDDLAHVDVRSLVQIREEQCVQVEEAGRVVRSAILSNQF